MKHREDTSSGFLENRFALLVATYAASFFLLAAAVLFLPHTLWEKAPLALLIVAVVVFYIPALFFLQSENGKEAELGACPLPKREWGPLALWALSAFAFGACGSLLYNSLDKALLLYGVIEMPASFSFVSFFTFVIVCPFCEELLCRGLIETHFLAHGPVLSVFCSACLSAAFGFSFFALPFFLVMGLLLSIVRLRTGSLFSALACASFLRLGMYLSSVGIWQDVAAFMGKMWTAIAFGLLALALFFTALFVKRRKRQTLHFKTHDSADKKSTSVLFSILALALSIGVSFLI